MSILLDLPLYVVYALAGTSAAALAKAAIHRAQARHWPAAAWRAAAAVAAILTGFGLLVFLLSRADLSVMAPVAIGLNLVTAACLSRWVFHERIDAWKAAGMVLIAVGVAVLSRGA